MRRRTALATVATLPLLAAACGSGGGGGSATPTLGNLTPLAYVKHATSSTATAPGHVTLEATIDASGQQGKFSAEGDVDSQRHLGALHLDMNVGPLNGSFDEILSGTTLYMRSPLFSAHMPQGKSWLKLDLGKAGKAEGIDFSALLSQDPTRTLGQLKGLVQVKKVGIEKIDGTTTTHFVGHIDVSKVPQGAQLKLANAAFTPVDIWVDGAGYIRREKFGVAYVVPDGSDADMLMQIDYSDLGKTLNITVPPDSQVLDLLSLAGLGG
jgi:LppX_LprAFG lipoprotein